MRIDPDFAPPPIPPRAVKEGSPPRREETDPRSKPQRPAEAGKNPVNYDDGAWM